MELLQVYIRLRPQLNAAIVMFFLIATHRYSIKILQHLVSTVCVRKFNVRQRFLMLEYGGI
jgi:hypothetical protein